MTRFAEPILHVDMDSFFVEVERLDDPELIGRPVAVGGTGGRGVVASASYEARSFGVRSAMPVGEARRRCPDLVIVNTSHGRYGAVSADIFDIMRSFTPMVEGISIDEAFLDVSGLRLHYEEVEDVGAQIRAAIRDRVGIPASVGIAANKFVAKLASKHAKPDGMLRIVAGTELEFLHPLDVGELWGVGEATERSLNDLGIRTIGELARAPKSLLEDRIGKASAQHLSALAKAEDPRTVDGGTPTRSISSEGTFARDLRDRDAIERETLRMCDQVAARLAKSRVSGHTVTLKVRFSDFATISRSFRHQEPVASTTEIWETAQMLIDRAAIGARSVRLLGVAVSDLVDGEDSRQMVFGRERADAAAEAVDEVRERFGAGAVMPARVASRPADPGRSDGGKI
ncbi:MAG: DNA polymerase IV [Actinomycetota bacterium]|nr:DNA polymerase IV [Actinomycetota bacterium]